MSDTSGPVTLTGIETSDANMIAIDNTNPIVPLLDIQSNVAFGIPKLDSTGKLGLAQMPTSSAQFLGYFDASPGVLPATAGITSGDYYAVSVQGTLTVYDPVTLTAAPTLVVVGSQLHFVSGSVSNPTGWYTLTVASATLASDIQFIPGGTLNGTNVQTAISELDSETQTALGGKAPSAAATGAGTSFPPSGSISASNVTAAIQELDTETVKLAGGTMTGNLTGTNFLAPKHQVGVSATPANNFTLDASANNGTIKLARNSGQDIVTVDAAGKPRFPQLAQSLATDGYKVLEGGLILQWGQCANDNAQFSGGSLVTFPIPFPTAVLHVSVEAYAASVGASAGMNTARIPFGSETNSYAVIAWYGANNALTTEQLAGQWFAIGY